MDGADINQLSNAALAAKLQDIPRAIYIDMLNPVTRMRGHGDDPRAVYDTGMRICACKEAFERNLVAYVARHDANVLRKLPRKRIAFHHQRPNFRFRVLQLRQHSASKKARRSRNQIFLKHLIFCEET